MTDNDSLDAVDEGSLIFTDHPALAHLPRGASILVVATESARNALRFPEDRLPGPDSRYLFYAGNDILDADQDAWFKLGNHDT